MKGNQSMKEVKPLSGNGKLIKYEIVNDVYQVEWNTAKFNVCKQDFNKILINFFRDGKEWYPLGASVTNPISGGLGEYVKKNIHGLSEKHSSAIASIMVNENLIGSKGLKPIYLKKLVSE
jgi:hypothetical protein